MAETPAGWYPDPKMAGTQRYWDGDRWTDHAAPVAPPTQRPPGMLTGARTVALGILIALAVVFVIFKFATANDGLDCAIENANRAAEGQPELVCP